MRSGSIAKDLETLQRLAVELSFYCVKQEKDKAKSVFTKNEFKRRTLHVGEGVWNLGLVYRCRQAEPCSFS